MKLTERTIAALACEEGKRDRLVFDDTVSGLGVRITASGSKTFLVQYTVAGQKRRVPLGRWGSLSLDQARTAARGILGDVAKGADPAADLKAAREAAATEAQAEKLTLRVLLEDWDKLGLVSRRDSYRKEAVRAVSTVFAAFLDRRADAITRADAVRTLDALVKNGKHAMAGRTLAYGRACFGWAVKRDRLAANPFQGLPIPAAITARDRVLSDEEVGAIYEAAGTLGYPFAPLVRLLLLTAQRRDEVAGMRWSEISDDMTVWTLPGDRAKNGKPHVVHLSDEARAVLATVPRQQDDEGHPIDLLFTTTGKTPASGFSKATERLTIAVEKHRIALAEKAGRKPPKPMPEWRLHDFRRSCVTWLAGAGFSPHVADKLLNHVAAGGLSDVGRVYQRNAFLPERKAALETWGKHVLACVDGKRSETGNIVPLPVRSA
ncbi:tyrosine-type recombinase/integrase [Azospirillum thermophilum]|uniref:Integrase n=1 Tax=Azospirillum thermophilum TaxID=2202148 RepID=A0A2S2CN13_9PROT|nr:site-specific integrase [Azospirillum thermophilum]AWK85914.1 integrase [Azospirillum thermophilum]